MTLGSVGTTGLQVSFSHVLPSHHTHNTQHTYLYKRDRRGRPLDIQQQCAGVRGNRNRGHFLLFLFQESNQLVSLAEGSFGANGG